MTTQTDNLLAEIQDLADKAQTYAAANDLELAELRRIRFEFWRKLAQLLRPAIPAIATRGDVGVLLPRVGLVLGVNGTWFPGPKNQREVLMQPAPLSSDELGDLRISPEAALSGLVDLLARHADGHANANKDLQRERRRFQALLVLLEG